MSPEELCRKGSEHGEQSALICWTALPETREAYPDAIKLYAINNNAGVGGNARENQIRGARAKMAGVRAGVADLFLPVARQGCHGLYVEMKQRKFLKRKDGGLQEDQLEFKAQVLADGYGYFCAHGWELARDVIISYLG